MNLANALIDSVRQYPDKTAIYWGGTEISYNQVLGQSEWVKRYLMDVCDIQPGDRVALWMKNTPEFVSIFFGALRAGAVIVPLNHFLTASEALFILQDSGAKLVFVDNSLVEAAFKVCETLTDLGICKLKELDVDHSEFDNVVQSDVLKNEQDLALIIYTSGTTGRPKGAMLSHGNLHHNVASCEHTMQTSENDKVALLLPMFHSFMVTVGILLPMKIGGSIVLIKSLHPPKNILKEIIASQATIMPAVPQFYRAFAAAPLPELPLRLCISGAAPLPMEVLKRFNQQSNLSLIESYGLSEASPVVTLNPIDGPWKVGSIGLPIHDVQVAIMDPKGNEMPVGQKGELWVRGDNVMLGYWNRPEATAEALQDGWLKTGDMGHSDEEGYFYVTDRKKDMLLVNGINVYPREIEELLYQFEGVKEASVVGQKDQRKGEKPVAFVVMEEGCSRDPGALQAFLKPRLAAYKIPRKINFIENLPRNATGKILKTALRQQLH
ncbi:long-chain fatty acid--CoA ligase [bacterium]|nr:long-chain fatty acid--CoA ligase [bacterium]